MNDVWCMIDDRCQMMLDEWMIDDVTCMIGCHVMIDVWYDVWEMSSCDVRWMMDEWMMSEHRYMIVC